MKKVVLANIGNRNLKYKGEIYYYKTHGSTFKEWTKQLLVNFEEVKTHLSINILNDLLDNLSDEVEHVLLFSSNQIYEEKQDQDTLYEAEILHALISEKYNVTVDSSKQVTCKVTDNDALLRFYRKELRSIKQSFPSHKIVICDAGGTAQQKSALKIMAEFLLEENDFQVSYINPNGTLEDVPQLEYRKVIETEQLIALIKGGNFQAARQLALKQNWSEISDLCQIGYLRLDHIWGDAQKIIHKEWIDEEYVFLKTFKTGKTSTNYDNLKRYFKQKHNFFLLCERFQIAEYYCINKDYTKASVAVSIFIETFINEIISRNSVFDLCGNYVSMSKTLSVEIENENESIKSFFGGEIRSSLPLHIIYAETLISEDADEILEIIDCIKALNSKLNGMNKGIDSLRNNVAHNGKGITESEFFLTVPHFFNLFGTIKKCIGLSILNPFIELQELIISKTKEL